MRLRTANNHKRRNAKRAQRKFWQGGMRRFSGALTNFCIQSENAAEAHRQLDTAYRRFTMGGRMMGKTLEMVRIATVVDVTAYADYPIRKRKRR